MKCYLTLFAIALLSSCNILSVHPQKYLLHVMPHSHLDAGWLNSMEGNYNAVGREIISSVTNALYADPELRFNFADIVFLEYWWNKDHVTTPE
jgi:hypothetical protein